MPCMVKGVDLIVTPPFPFVMSPNIFHLLIRSNLGRSFKPKMGSREPPKKKIDKKVERDNTGCLICVCLV